MIRPQWGLVQSTTVTSIVMLCLISSSSSGHAKMPPIGTLKTLKSESCHGETLDLICPPRSDIHLKRVHFLTDESCIQHELFPPHCQNFTHESNRAGQEALRSELRGLCHQHQACEVETTGNETCLAIGTRILVTFKCRPNVYSKRIFCGRKSIALECPDGYILALYSTNVFSGECPPSNGFYEQMCLETSSSETFFKGRCDGRTRCVVKPQELKTFCPGTDKSVMTRIVYTCVADKVLWNAVTERSTEAELRKADGVIAGHDLTPASSPSSSPSPSSSSFSSSSFRPSNSTPMPVPVLESVHSSPGGDRVMAEGNESSITPPPTLVCGDTQTPSALFGILQEWVTAYRFLKENREKLILYLVVSMAGAVLAVCLVLILRLYWSAYRLKRREEAAKAEPVPTFLSTEPSGEDSENLQVSIRTPTDR